MCGINVLVTTADSSESRHIRQMAACTQHRGPDQTGYAEARVNGQQFYFAHNRLRIVDLSPAADQPMYSACGRYLLLLNGEIYNFKELRQLTPDYHYQTHSDTEVVLALLISRGKSALPLLNGMFALVFFDTQTGELLAARDRFGVKPLYYACTNSQLVLSSELRAITSSGLLPKKLNESQLHHYLRFKHAKKPQTFYEGVLEVPEGAMLIYQNQRLSVSSFLPSGTAVTNEQTEEQITLTTEQLLLKSVERQLASDVPVGLFLSGGTDSTLLLALLSELGHTGFRTFSINTQPEEKSFGTEDHFFAPQAAAQYRAHHTSFSIGPDLLQLLPEAVYGLGQPIADSALLLTYYLSKQAKNKVTVALSGAGADELFGGYNRHHAFYKYLKYLGVIRPAIPFMQWAAGKLPTGFHHPLRKKFQLLKKLGLSLEKDAKQTFVNFTAMQPALSKLLQPELAAPNVTQASPITTTNELAWALEHDQHQYLISDILTLTDAMSMRHSLEVRVPFLDNELAAYLAALPANILFEKGRKWVLRAALAKRGGNTFAYRQKEGFGLPFGAWLRLSSCAWVLAPLQNKHHVLFNYLQFEPTQCLLKAHLSQQHDYAIELWALVVLAWWLENEFS